MSNYHRATNRANERIRGLETDKRTAAAHLGSDRYNRDGNILDEMILQKSNRVTKSPTAAADNKKITAAKNKNQAARGLSTNAARGEKIETKRKK